MGRELVVGVDLDTRQETSAAVHSMRVYSRRAHVKLGSELYIFLVCSIDRCAGYHPRMTP